MSIISLSRFIMMCPGGEGKYLWFFNGFFDKDVEGYRLDSPYELIKNSDYVRFQMKESL